jgi:hypothetical protein
MTPLLPSLILGVILTQPAPPDPTLLRPGMTAAEVVNLLGQPKRVARQIIYKRCLEQWLYDSPPVRIDFDSVQGRHSQILTVHPIRPARP